MWNDLNMRDRHKFIKLAVTNGVYDLDTIHSLYNSNNFEEGGIVENRRKKDNTEEEVINVDNQHDYKRIHWHEVDKSPTGNTAYGDVYQIRQPKDRKDFLALKKDIRETYPDAKIFVKNGTNYFRVPYLKEPQPQMPNAESPKYIYPSIEYKYIEPSYTPLPLSGHNYNEDYWGEGALNIPEGFKNEEDIYNNYMLKYYTHLKNLDEVNAFLKIYKKFPVNSLEYDRLWSQNTLYDNKETWYSGYKPNPENTFYNPANKYYGYYIPNDFFIQQHNNKPRIGRLELKVKPIEIKYDEGGNLPTEPNRLSIDTSPIIDRIKAERLAKYTATDSALAQIKELTDNIRENEFRREFAEWINPTRNTNDYVDIRRTIPVAEARPTFIKTYKDGGNTGNLPYDWTKAWKKESNKQTDYKHIGKYNVTTTDGNSMVTVPRNVDNINTELTLNSNNYTPDMSWYKDPLTNTKMVTEMPIEPLYGFKDPVFMAALGTGALAKGALTPVTHIIKEGIKPTLTVMSKPLTSITKVFGNTVNPFLATKMIKGASLGDLIINNALTLNGINNAFSNNGLEKTYNHIKKGEYYSGIKSGLGDLLDLSGMIGIANSLNKINKVINKNKLGRNILDDLSNELFYLKEPEKLNIYLQEAENNARNKVLKINNYRDYRLMAIPAPLNLNKINKYTNISFPRHFKDYGYKKVLTSQGYNDVGDIKINPMNIGYMIGKNKQSPLPLEGLLGHELDHSYQPYLYTSPSIPDNTIHYWSANPQSPDYNIWKVLDKNKKTHSWASSPDEVLSEMTNWKILKNEYQIPYKEIQNKQYYINNISRRFHISKEQAKDLLQKASEKGYF